MWTTGEITSMKKEETGWLIGIKYPDEFRNMIVGRGSITVEDKFDNCP